MAAKVTYKVKVWDKKSGLSTHVIDVLTCDPKEATDKYLSLKRMMEPCGFGLALEESIENRRELDRTR